MKERVYGILKLILFLYIAINLLSLTKCSKLSFPAETYLILLRTLSGRIELVTIRYANFSTQPYKYLHPYKYNLILLPNILNCVEISLVFLVGVFEVKLAPYL